MDRACGGRPVTPSGANGATGVDGEGADGVHGLLPRVRAVDMDDQQIRAWAGAAREAYARDLAGSGLGPAAALAKAEADHARLLPGGRARTGDRLLSLLVDDSPGGVLWLGPRDPADPGAWWVWDIEVDERLRGRGVGRAAMRLAEQLARSAGARSLGLNVFGAKTVARFLYESLGYRADAIQMSLDLGDG